MATQRKQIVIVDDDETLLKLLTYEFHNIGFEVKTFVLGKPALDFLSVEKNLNDVALVILDRILPDMDGIDILKKFTQMFPKQVPVLILSVLADEQNVLTGLNLGAVDYVAKPFSVFLLLQKALHLLGLK
ncbi:MAG: response regulator [Verrucomicrobia bacterium]|nr:response regulator [Verrucomicrobiota bacterium]MBU6446268.1 response regulator [Verrucomicrobiota bacterium]MDE3047954.1 response regulator [Verrucomicrobiota bacterium]